MYNFIWVLTTAFWILMIFDCAKNETDTRLWMWILILGNFAGAAVYFFLRYLPRLRVPLPRYFNRWTHQQELWNAEAAARNIGNDHQYVDLGNVLHKMGILDRAAEAYDRALEKNPANLQALWGAACVQVETNNYESGKQHLQAILKIDPDFKYGEASAALGHVLVSLQELDAAKAHLEQHVKRWSSPESRLIIAEIALQQNNVEEARNQLETMIINLRGGPQYHYRKHRHLVRKAESLLRNIRG